MPPGVRVHLILSLLLLGSSCGVQSEPPGLPPVDLPRVGTIGMSPYELDGPTLVVTIDSKGAVLLDGEVLGAEAMSEALVRHAEPSAAGADRTDRPSRWSESWLVLRCDRAAPWRATLEALAAAVKERIYRVVFVVRPEDGPGVGSFAFFPPIGPRGPATASRIELAPMRAAAIRIEREGTLPATPADLHAAIRARYPGEPPAAAILHPDGDVETGFVLRTADATLRAGIPAIVLRGASAEQPAGSPGLEPSICLDGLPVPAGAVSFPEAPPRRSDGLVGVIVKPERRLEAWWGPVCRPEDRVRIVKGLSRLAAAQAVDGGWGDIPETSLVLLAFLEASETHKSVRHGRVVRRGLAHLKQRQRGDGVFGDPGGPGSARSHALATLAMVEAYVRTSSPLFKQSARQALARILEDPEAPRSPWADLALLAAKDQNLGVPAEHAPADSPAWPPEEPAGTATASEAWAILRLLPRE